MKKRDKLKDISTNSPWYHFHLPLRQNDDAIPKLRASGCRAMTGKYGCVWGLLVVINDNGQGRVSFTYWRAKIMWRIRQTHTRVAMQQQHQRWSREQSEKRKIKRKRGEYHWAIFSMITIMIMIENSRYVPCCRFPSKRFSWTWFWDFMMMNVMCCLWFALDGSRTMCC